MSDEYKITREEHINIYDGKKTLEKLRILSETKGLPESNHQSISDSKQSFTMELLNSLSPINEIIKLFQELEEQGYKIGVCSNSIRRTVLTALSKSELIHHCSVIVSNEDVKNSKPHPEMYWKSMSIMGAVSYTHLTLPTIYSV